MDNLTVDISEKKSFIISFHVEAGKEVFQLITEGITIVLNREQMERLGYC